jgi:hypothetical protein
VLLRLHQVISPALGRLPVAGLISSTSGTCLGELERLALRVSPKIRASVQAGKPSAWCDAPHGTVRLSAAAAGGVQGEVEGRGEFGGSIRQLKGSPEGVSVQSSRGDGGSQRPSAVKDAFSHGVLRTPLAVSILDVKQPADWNGSQT